LKQNPPKIRREKELRKMVSEMNEEIMQKTGYPLPSGWLTICVERICSIFKKLKPSSDWINVLAGTELPELTDDLLCGPQSRSKEVRKYIKMIRDYARRYEK